jgi:hypothetical protein
MALRAIAPTVFKGYLGRLGDASLPFGRQQDVRPIFVFLDQPKPELGSAGCSRFFRANLRLRAGDDRKSRAAN